MRTGAKYPFNECHFVNGRLWFRPGGPHEGSRWEARIGRTHRIKAPRIPRAPAGAHERCWWRCESSAPPGRGRYRDRVPVGATFTCPSGTLPCALQFHHAKQIQREAPIPCYAMVICLVPAGSIPNSHPKRSPVFLPFSKVPIKNPRKFPEEPEKQQGPQCDVIRHSSFVICVRAARAPP